jgi:2,4-didehydro-3-deoxy-L-rhamnonate hydrolase
MKLVRYGRAGAEKPGLIDKDGVLRDLSRVVKDIGPDALSPGVLRKIKQTKPERLRKVPGRPRLGVPVAGIGKVICIGLNYREHARETGNPIPEQPIVFLKPTSAINGPYDKVINPRGASRLDWEVELGVVIGRKGRYIDESKALGHVAGYCVCNDVSERLYQMKGGGGQWTKGKACDTFGPIGPWLVTADEVKDPQALHVWTDVNGKRMQDNSTGDMVFNVKQLIADVSKYMTLEPGDVIMTGTPQGVGSGMNPPQFLKPGDIVEVGIDGLGRQKSVIVSADKASRG